MDLTNHQANVGSVLEFGNQLISEGLVSEKEENEIRDQMMSLNDRWENLRISAMERQSKYVNYKPFIAFHDFCARTSLAILGICLKTGVI